MTIIALTISILATVGPHDHAGCIRAAGYEPTLEEA